MKTKHVLSAFALAAAMASTPALAEVVRYDLTAVSTAVGHYPSGIYTTGSMLGYFVLDDTAATVPEFVITSVVGGAVDFEWSSFAGFPHPVTSFASRDAATGLWDLTFAESLGDHHGVTLELVFPGATSGQVPLVPSSDGRQGTSNWFEIIDSEYAEFGWVRKDSVLSVPEPASLALLVPALLMLGVGLTRASRASPKQMVLGHGA